MEVTQKTVFEVDYNDLDDKITQFLESKGYPFNETGYECIAENEWNNDSCHLWPITNKLSEYTRKKIEKLGHLGTGEIMDWMCSEGLIEPGEYLITICW